MPQKSVLFFALSLLASSILPGIALGQTQADEASWGESLEKVWQKAKSSTKDIINQGSEITKGWFEPEIKQLGDQEQYEKRLQRVWNDLIGKLDQGLATRYKLEQAPSFSLWSDDKDDVQKDYNRLMQEVLNLIADPQMHYQREVMSELKDKIQEIKYSNQSLKEKRIMARLEDKRELDKKLSQNLAQIDDYEEQISQIETRFQQYFSRLGIQLNRAQVNMLLSRVDSNNILQMLDTLDILKQITAKLGILLKDSKEDLNQAKRYYGMHLVLLEMLAYLQGNYLEQINTSYLPRLGLIKDKTLKVKEQAKQKMQQDNNAKRKQIYQQNIKAHQLTLNIVKIYEQHLRQQYEKIQHAKERLQGDIDLAENTYNTVIISAELSHVLQSSLAVFKSLQKIQIPEIIPFENLQMQAKYAELSQVLKQP